MEEEEEDESIFGQGAKVGKIFVVERLKCIYNKKIRMLKETWLYSKEMSN